MQCSRYTPTATASRSRPTASPSSRPRSSSDKTLSDRAKLLYLEIRRYARDEGRCWACQATLADDLGWSVRKVQMAADELLKAGWITRIRTGRSNRYIPQTRRVLRVCSATPCVSDPQPVAYEVDAPKKMSRSGGGSGTERARTTATTTPGQLSKIAELVEERAVESRHVETFADADREIKRLLALPRAKAAECVECGDAYTHRPDDDETRCPECAERAAAEQRARQAEVDAKWEAIYQRGREQHARLVARHEADGLPPDVAREAARREELMSHRHPDERERRAAAQHEALMDAGLIERPGDNAIPWGDDVDTIPFEIAA